MNTISGLKTLIKVQEARIESETRNLKLLKDKLVKVEAKRVPAKKAEPKKATPKKKATK